MWGAAKRTQNQITTTGPTYHHGYAAWPWHWVEPPTTRSHYQESGNDTALGCPLKVRRQVSCISYCTAALNPGMVQKN